MKNNFEDEVQELLLLSSMPDSWNTLIASVRNLALDVKLTSEMVKNSMLNGEYRKNKKKVMPPHLMLMWLNPTIRMKLVEVAKQDFNKVKTRNLGEIKVKTERSSHLLLL
jgi:hypothetical protein